jgi:polyvinyl alcohol dehydrogenase (cytochrome)
LISEVRVRNTEDAEDTEARIFDVFDGATKMNRWLFVILFSLATSVTPVFGQIPDGSALFAKHCATCHAGNDPRIPTVTALRAQSPEAVINALTNGVMRERGSALTVAERRAVAEFLSGKPSGTVVTSSVTGRCPTAPAAFDLGRGPRWTGWGVDLANTRFQPAAQAGLTAEQTPQLKLKWAFGFPNATSARALPTVADGRLFVGSQDGTVYSLDAKSGCTIWAFKAASSVRTSIVLGPRRGGSNAVAYFGDGRSNIYALDAGSGQLLWTRKLDEHPSSHITGSPALYQDRLFVVVASGEEGRGSDPKYECCTFRGSVASLDIANGNVLWKTYTMEEARTIGKNSSGTTRWGPSGAGVWATATIDVKRRLVYAATGNNYTEPAQTTSDAVLALAMDTGRIVWSTQLTPNDVFVTGCGQQRGANCPEPDKLGPDFDFGNSPMLTTLPGGRDLIVIGQKSGIGWALDPDKHGAVVWQYRAGRGSALGGMEFGSAVDDQRAYFGVADGNQSTAGELHAVRLDTGERAWVAMPRPTLCGERMRGCTPALLAAITVIPGVVFAGSQDGGIRGYSTKDGSVIWEFDTNREFQTVNGVPARGASINGPGPIVVGGMLFVNSGYGALGGRPGNVLLAFGAD